jgi:glutaredoxin-related protein
MSSDEEWKPVAPKSKETNKKKKESSEEEEEEWKPKAEQGKKWSDSEEEEWVPYVPTEPLKKEIELDDPGELKLYYTSLNVNPDYFYKSRDLKIILEQFGLKYTKIDLNLVNEFRVEMESISKKKHLPQLFIDENYLGSFDDIMYWVENEEFEQVLKEQGYKAPEYVGE